MIELVLTGILSGEDIRECTEESVLLHKELGVHAYLIDAIDLESLSSFTDLYELPRQYDDGGVSRAARIS